MFRTVLHFKDATHAMGDKGFSMVSGAFPTWEQANAILEECYATRTRGGKLEVCGGGIEQKTANGWCVCDTPPEEPFVEDDIVVILGPNAAWSLSQHQ
jgi:hypothetical protein